MNVRYYQHIIRLYYQVLIAFSLCLNHHQLCKHSDTTLLLRQCYQIKKITLGVAGSYQMRQMVAIFTDY